MYKYRKLEPYIDHRICDTAVQYKRNHVTEGLHFSVFIFSLHSTERNRRCTKTRFCNTLSTTYPTQFNVMVVFPYFMLSYKNNRHGILGECVHCKSSKKPRA